MKNILLILILSGWFINGIFASDNTGTDPGLSYLKAKQAAELRDMKYVLYFKADWCTPCKWMEETTFQDAQFINALDNQFIFVPLDIDVFEGYALKEYFQVFTLPTMLVFNDKHEIINRAEGSLSATAFLHMLEGTRQTAAPIASNSRPLEVINTRPENSQPAIQEVALQNDRNSSLPDLPNELIESVTKYSVQLGAFSSLSNAQSIQDQASQYTTEHIEITTIPNGDKIIYKVFAGRLENEIQAHQLQKLLSSYGMNGFVKPIVVSHKS